MRSHNPRKGVIFDLGDVLLNWSPSTSTCIPPKMMRNMLSSDTWAKYECGDIAQDECYDLISQQFSVSALEVAEAFSQARDSLQPNQAMVSFIQDLKAQFRGGIKIYAMSNVSKEDYSVLSTRLTDWSIFNRIFTSGHAGMRKPNTNFYQHVLRNIQLAPEETLFIDDKTENVLAAKSLGIDSIVFDNNVNVIQSVRTILHDPIGRAFQYLQNYSKEFDSFTDTGVNVPDNFAQLLILETLQERSPVRVEWGSRRSWNYFRGKPLLTPGNEFPDDLDTTSMALMTLRPSAEITSSLLEEMLTYVNPDGTFQVSQDA